MPFGKISFSSLDTNQIFNSPGRLDAAEIAVAHRAGYIWAREGQTEEMYNKAQDEFIRMTQEGHIRKIHQYRQNLEKEIIESEFPPRKPGENKKITPEEYQMLIDFDTEKRLRRNLFKSRERARKEAEEYVSAHYIPMTTEQMQERAQKAYNAFWKINNTYSEENRKTEEELKAKAQLYISELDPTFKLYVLTYLGKEYKEEQ